MADNEEFLKQAEVAFFFSGLNMIGPSMLFCSMCFLFSFPYIFA